MGIWPGHRGYTPTVAFYAGSEISRISSKISSFVFQDEQKFNSRVWNNMRVSHDRIFKGLKLTV